MVASSLLTDSQSNQYLFAHWVLPVDASPIENGFVAFKDNLITAVDTISQLPESLQREARKILGQSHHMTILTPGLINTHAHLELTYPKPIPLYKNETMADWLLRVVQQTRDTNTEREIIRRCYYGATEMLKSGTTCINDISQTGQSFDTLKRAGLRGVVAMEFFFPGHLQSGKLPPRIEELILNYKQTFKAQADDLRLAALSPHSPYNVSPTVWRLMVDHCKPFLVHTHLAESIDEQRWLLEQPNGIDRLHKQLLGRATLPQWSSKIGDRTFVGYLEKDNLLEDPLMIAHGSLLSAKEQDKLAQLGIGVSHCPRSNLMLHHQTMTWPKQSNQPHELNVGLGTDSKLSCPDLDLRAEARQAVDCHRFSARHALHCCTLGGAKAMRLADKIGSLTVGKYADITLWQTENSPNSYKNYSYIEDAWLDCNTMLSDIFVDGIKLMAK